MYTRIKRWLILRCDHCGHRFRWKRDYRSSFGNRDGKVWHGPCIAYIEWRKTADERLAVLDLVMEITGVTEYDIKLITELRATTDEERTAASNRAFRVFRSLRQLREESKEPQR